MDRQRRLELQRGLARLAKGDRAAFRLVFDLAWPAARAISGRLLSHGADADDAAQVALLKVFERCSEYQPERDALSWIVAIVSYECMSIRKKQSRRRELACASSSVNVVDGGASPEELAIAADLEDAALDVLGQLSPQDRETLRAAWSGESASGARPATFRKRLERALCRLRAAWRNHGIG